MNFSKLYINGQWVEPITNKKIQVEDPSTKKIIEEVPACGVDDVEYAIESAKRAFLKWKNIAPSVRHKMVEDMIHFLIESYEEMAPILAKELGCTKKFARETHLDSYTPAMEGFLEDHKKILYKEQRDGYILYRRPQGIVACLTPWNYPFGQIVRKVIPALLAGNTLILKPSKSTPLTAYFWAKAAHKAQLPNGVFNLVTGKGSEVGNILAQDPRVNAISFTGSTHGGREVASLALNSSMKRLTLELGGKSAAIFLQGANYKKDLEAVLDSVYYNVGQTCSAKTRLIIPRKDKEKVEEILIQLTQQYRFGNPSKEEDIDVGVLNSQKQFDKVKKYIQIGLDEGADILYGEMPEDGNLGYEVGPVIFTNVQNYMKIAQEEIFGPVLCLITYETIEEAIDIANDSIYGLSGMVFGGNRDENLRVASEIFTGQIQINGATRIQNAPFGGFKESGFGREGTFEGLDEFYEYQTVFI